MLADDVGFEILGEILGSDVKSSIEAALTGGAVFLNSNNPLSIFWSTLMTSIRDIELHPRGRLFQKFLIKGPFERNGEIPQELKGDRLSDEETSSVITFIYSYMINSFKCAIAELLAAGACMRWLGEYRYTSGLPDNTRLYVGDAISMYRKEGKGLLKGTD